MNKQFDRPFRRRCLRLRAGWRGRGRRPTRSGRAARQRSSWLLDVLALAQTHARRQQIEFRPPDAGDADRAFRPRSGPHPDFARQEPRQRDLELRIGEQEDALAREHRAIARRAPSAARARPGAVTASNRSGVDVRKRRRLPQPEVVPSAPSGKGAPMALAPRSSRARARIAEERLRKQERGPGPTGAGRPRAASGEIAPARRPARRTDARTGPRRRPQARRRPAASGSASAGSARQRRNERRQTGVLALRERGLDAAAGIAENADPRRMETRLPRRGPLQVDLDHFGRTGADEKERA